MAKTYPKNLTDAQAIEAMTELKELEAQTTAIREVLTPWKEKFYARKGKGKFEIGETVVSCYTTAPQAPYAAWYKKVEGKLTGAIRGLLTKMKNEKPMIVVVRLCKKAD